MSHVCGRELSIVSGKAENMATGGYVMYSNGRYYAAQIRDIEYRVAVAAYRYVYIFRYIDFFISSGFGRESARPAN